MSKAKRKAKQDGGTFLGLILGMMIGLGIALGVAFYVSRLPNPFVAKNPSRLAGQGSIDRGKDPNASLRSRGEVQPLPPVETRRTTAADLRRAIDQREAPRPEAPAPEKVDTAAVDKTPPRTAEQRPATSAAPAPAPAPAAEQRPAAPAPAPAPAAAPAPRRQSADPLGDLVAARSRAYATPSKQAQPSQGADPFTYFVQAGAFRIPADAEAQRARLLLLGVQASVTQREQAGRPIWRVRVGPFQNQDAAERTKTRLAENGFDAALVRVQR